MIFKKYLMSEQLSKTALILWKTLYYLLQFSLRISAKKILKKRLRMQKEHPERWREKLGETNRIRPQGELIWLHGVGLGEVMALRGLISIISQNKPNINFLVTSGTVQSAELFSQNLPVNTTHQFIPFDVHKFRQSFLSRWKPNLVIWSEQEIWPGFVNDCTKLKIPQVWVNARMGDEAYNSRKWLKPFFGDLYANFKMISVQDGKTAKNISKLIKPDLRHRIRVDGSLKPAAPRLQSKQTVPSQITALIKGRKIFTIVSSHFEDEQFAINSFKKIPKGIRPILLIIPRHIERTEIIRDQCTKADLQCTILSELNEITPISDVYVSNQIGAPAIWLPLTNIALIGGTYCNVNGHNPWEPIQFGAAVLHGSKTANFAEDFKDLLASESSTEILETDEMAKLITQTNFDQQIKNASLLLQKKLTAIKDLSNDILLLLSSKPI
jgi:3-deoxy-D-manno-octulosonic-acid transferase